MLRFFADSVEIKKARDSYVELCSCFSSISLYHIIVSLVSYCFWLPRLFDACSLAFSLLLFLLGCKLAGSKVKDGRVRETDIEL